MRSARQVSRRSRRAAARVAALAVVVAVAVVATSALVGVPGAGAADPPRRDLLRPVATPLTVATPYSPPSQRWLAGHRGVDLAAPAFTPVRAPAAARVAFAGSVAGRPVLSLDHGDGLRTTYEPVHALVRTGDEVAAGATVGRLLAGHPGCPAEACLHWGARLAAGGTGGDDDDYLDPLALLAASDRPIRLKPLLPGDGAR
jgi:murein DD-endopeptidase MepM/ murein hydrolase activator NlpD